VDGEKPTHFKSIEHNLEKLKDIKEELMVV
jgi:hypothetical protein